MNLHFAIATVHGVEYLASWNHKHIVNASKREHIHSVEFIDSHCYIFDVNPPNDFELMSFYVEAFHKVMDQLDAVLDAPETS